MAGKYKINEIKEAVETEGLELCLNRIVPFDIKDKELTEAWGEAREWIDKIFSILERGENSRGFGSKMED